MPETDFHSQLTALRGYPSLLLQHVEKAAGAMSAAGKEQLILSLKGAEEKQVSLLTSCVKAMGSGLTAMMELTYRLDQPADAPVDTATLPKDPALDSALHLDDPHAAFTALLSLYATCHLHAVRPASSQQADMRRAWITGIDGIGHAINAYAQQSIAATIDVLMLLRTLTGSDSDYLREMVRELERIAVQCVTYVSLGEAQRMPPSSYKTQDGTDITITAPQKWLSYRIELPAGWEPLRWRLTKGMLSGRSMTTFMEPRFQTEKRLRAISGQTTGIIEDMYVWTVDLAPGSRLDLWTLDSLGYAHEFSVLSEFATPSLVASQPSTSPTPEPPVSPPQPTPPAVPMSSPPATEQLPTTVAMPTTPAPSASVESIKKDVPVAVSPPPLATDTPTDNSSAPPAIPQTPSPSPLTEEHPASPDITDPTVPGPHSAS